MTTSGTVRAQASSSGIVALQDDSAAWVVCLNDLPVLSSLPKSSQVSILPLEVLH